MSEIIPFELLLSGEQPAPEMLSKACIDGLNRGQAYRVWRWLDRLEKIQSAVPQDARLLQAKALQLCGRPDLAIAVLENTRAAWSNKSPVLSFFLQLLSEASSELSGLASHYAMQCLGKTGSPQDILLAIGILRQLQVGVIGRCELQGDTIVGWLLDAETAPPLTVTIDGKDFSLQPFLATPFLQSRGVGGKRDGFSLKVPPGRFRSIRIHLDGVDLAGSPILLPGGDLPDADDTALLPAVNDATVDILVPVYKGCAETIACLQSVLTAENHTPYRLLVVDDASPDPDLAAYLDGLAAEGRITLLRQPCNQGFIKAVSRGLRAGGDRDVVLLNADTRVHGDWLDRLRTVAYSGEKIGTVTPLTNNGELVSYPEPMRSSEMPGPELLKRLDDACALLGPDAVVEIPVGVGFCLYVKRLCLEDAGGFDSGLMERGYCEDTDFCIRVGQSGWRNVCAGNVFVAHAGSVSFGDEKRVLVAKNVAKLYALYPHHSEEYDRFLASDPLRGVREYLQRSQLAAYCGAEAELAVMPRRRNGDYQTQRLEKRLRDGGRKLFYLLPDRDDEDRLLIKLRGDHPQQAVALTYRWPIDKRQFWLDIRQAGFKSITIYDLADWHWDVLQGLARLDIPYRLFLSDYAAYCPRITLTQPGLGYCGEPDDIEACSSCCERFSSRIEGMESPATLRRQAEAVLGNAAEISLPSESMANRYRARFPGAVFAFDSESLPEVDNARMVKPLPNDGVLRIAVLPSAGPDDNFQSILAVARLMAASRANAELIVFGESWDDKALLATGKAWATGPLHYDDLPRYLALHGCSMILHVPAWPAADATPWVLARQCGLRLAATAIGIFSELLDPSMGDIVLEPRQDAAAWLAAVL